MHKKNKTKKEIVKIVRAAKKRGKRIVATSGSFDIMHAGHIRTLRRAKNQGDVLIVLMNSDVSVSMYKGPQRPIMPQAMRAEMLAGLECVDYIVFFDDMNPVDILGKIKPDIYCVSGDWGKYCIEKDIVEKNGGKICVLKYVEGISTTDIIKKILKVYSKPIVKAVFLDRDGTINLNKDGYIHKIKDFEFTPGALSALKKLSKTDYKIIILANQSGIGRGYYKESNTQALHKWLVRELRKNGVRIDKIYYCLHHPDDDCSCRKPKIGMLLEAVKDFGINLNKSWMVGDSEGDIIMGKMANLKTIKIGGKNKNLNTKPHYYAENLMDAVNYILKL